MQPHFECGCWRLQGGALKAKMSHPISSRMAQAAWQLNSVLRGSQASSMAPCPNGAFAAHEADLAEDMAAGVGRALRLVFAAVNHPWSLATHQAFGPLQ
jgi:hypothetical protein